jgi:hypothetical protein
VNILSTIYCIVNINENKPLNIYSTFIVYNGLFLKEHYLLALGSNAVAKISPNILKFKTVKSIKSPGNIAK